MACCVVGIENMKRCFSVGAFSLKEKSPTITETSFFRQPHSEWSTFCALLLS